MAKAKATKIPAIAVIDCETDPFKYGRAPEPFIWGFTDGKTYRSFTSTDALVKHVAAFEGIVYAHNGGKFDYHFIVDHFTPETEILIINGRIAKAQIGKAEIRDSYSILPIPLSDYQKTEIDYAKFEKPVRHKHMKEIAAYLKDDCQFLFEIVSQFIATYGLGITLASSAMAFWKSMGHEVPESDKKYYDIIAPWYSGGRVQCFRTGIIQKEFHTVDINSAYPFAMLQQHPYSCTYTIKRRPSLKKISGASMYRVVAVSRGALPFRNDKGELIFPVDAKPREYHCTGWELRAGLETDTVRVLETIERLDFDELQSFSQYIHHFYELKKNSPKGSSAYIYAKLFMNSLYGKFAADPSSYKNFAVIESDQVPSYVTEEGKNRKAPIGRMKGPWAWAGHLNHLALITNSRILIDKDGIDEQTRSKFFNVATGASITGFVRAYLWKHICAVRKGGGQPMYCDTDCIVFTWPKKKKKIPFGLSKELGDWSHDGTFTYGAIAGKKLYAFRRKPGTRKPGMALWEWACKGVDISARQVVNIAKGGKVTHRRDAPSMRVGAKGISMTFIERTVGRTA